MEKKGVLPLLAGYEDKSRQFQSGKNRHLIGSETALKPALFYACLCQNLCHLIHKNLVMLAPQGFTVLYNLSLTPFVRVRILPPLPKKALNPMGLGLFLCFP